MKIIKKYTAIQLRTENVDDKVNLKLTYGDITGPYYSLDYPEEEFDTEEEATEYAYKTNQWISWLIIPIIKFDNFD